MIFRRLFAALLALGCLSAPVHAQQTKAQLTSAINACFPDNATGVITPAIVRSCLNQMLQSWQQFASVNAQTGTSYSVQQSDYGQLITVNNSSSVVVSVPQATGSFATFNFFISNLGTGVATISPSGSTINGSATLTLAQNQSAWIVSNGANYIAVFVLNVPTASTSQLGVVKGDGSTLTISGAGVISCTTATNSQIGCAKPDGTTITASGGTLTAVGASASSIDAAGATTISNGTSGCSLYDSSGAVACTTGGRRVVRVVTASGAVSVTTADDVVVVNKSVGAATTVNLPTSPPTNYAVTIKDGRGDASTNNITITPAAGTIDGASSLVIYINYQSITLVYNGTQWNAI